ncbi:MAG: hypothetical protein IKJ19_04370 [Clostridia bacterium]|nr:hypothetical protein [Clostridia bacterium]
MDRDFYFGVIAGMLGGALIAANSLKIRKAVREGQEQVMNTIATTVEPKKGSNKNSLSE